MLLRVGEKRVEGTRILSSCLEYENRRKVE